MSALKTMAIRVSLLAVGIISIHHMLLNEKARADLFGMAKSVSEDILEIVENVDSLRGTVMEDADLLAEHQDEIRRQWEELGL